MSLNNEYKNKLMHAISQLVQTIDSLENVPVDAAAIDMIDVAMGLIERQLAMDVEFIPEDEDEELEFLPATEYDGSSNQALDIYAPQAQEDMNNSAHADDEFNSGISLKDANFSFLDESDDDIPSADELADWFKIDFPKQ